MIDRHTYLSDWPNGGFSPWIVQLIGSIVGWLGYREVWLYLDRKRDEGGQKCRAIGEERRSSAHRNCTHRLNKMSAHDGANGMQPWDE